MATNFIDIEGRVYYPKINSPDTYNGDSRWTIQFAPTDFEDITNSGVELKRRPANEYIPEDHVQLRRPVKKLFGDTLVFFTAPFVFNSEGDPIRVFHNSSGTYTRSFEKGEEVELEGSRNVSINNGSLVAITISVYDTVKGKGHRLESIRIIEQAEKSENKQIEKQAETTTKTSASAKGKTPW